MKKLILLVIVCIIILTGNQLHSQITAQWTAQGPVYFPTNVSGQINGIGRVSQIKFHPSNSKKMYAVSASGGLYISENNGYYWKPTGTDQLPPTQCSSVCIDYTNDSILYLSTGDANYYNDDFGIWKSTDAGKIWKQSNNGIGNRMAIEIIMDPNDHKVLIAATSSGIWKTYDGGNSWTEKYAGDNFTDMKEKPESGGRVLYACSFDNFYRSIDRGESWTKITSGIYYPGGGSGGEGMRIAVTPADTNMVYIGMIANRGTVFKSLNGGTSFTNVKDDFSQSLVGYSSSESGQGNYNFDMFCDLVDANLLYIIAHVVWQSTDGGVTWNQLTDWWQGVHTDMHDLVISPYDQYSYYQANDGGVWLSPGGSSFWLPLSDGICATEIYHSATSPTRKNTVSIGTQDNGELYLNGTSWYTNKGGDVGTKMQFDYSNNSSMVYYYDDASALNILNGQNKWLTLPFSGGFNEIKFYKNDPNIAFVCKSEVYRTNNLLSNPISWKKISNWNSSVMAVDVSPDDPNILFVVTSNNKVYRSDDALSDNPTFVIYNSPASTSLSSKIATVKGNSQTVYLACGTKMFKSLNKGETWTNISGSLPPVNIINIINDIYTDDGSVFIANANKIYYRNDTMNSWMNFSQGLPTVAQITDFMIFNDGTSQSRLRVSYYGKGIWETPINIPAHPSSIDLTENNLETITIYPNPNNGTFTINLENFSEKVIGVELMDLLGKMIETTKRDRSDSFIFHENNLPQGIYFLNIKGEKTNITKKIVIH